MRPLSELQTYRCVSMEMRVIGDTGHPQIGYFIFPSPLDRKDLRCIVSTTDDWDHVSVSRKDRVPNWYEISYIKEKFFREDEWAMQVHPPRSEWVNHMPHCLHLWRPQKIEIPKPPSWMVGPKDSKKVAS